MTGARWQVADGRCLTAGGIRDKIVIRKPGIPSWPCRIWLISRNPSQRFPPCPNIWFPYKESRPSSCSCSSRIWGMFGLTAAFCGSSGMAGWSCGCRVLWRTSLQPTSYGYDDHQRLWSGAVPLSHWWIPQNVRAILGTDHCPSSRWGCKTRLMVAVYQPLALVASFSTRLSQKGIWTWLVCTSTGHSSHIQQSSMHHALRLPFSQPAELP